MRTTYRLSRLSPVLYSNRKAKVQFSLRLITDLWDMNSNRTEKDRDRERTGRRCCHQRKYDAYIHFCWLVSLSENKRGDLVLQQEQ